MPWGTPAGWVEPDPMTEARCLVSGVYRAPGGGAGAGTCSFAPARAGVWRGEFVSADRVTVTPGPDGRFTVALVPSEAVGRYAVRLGDQRFTIEVPARSSADLAAIVVGDEAKEADRG